MIIVIMFGELFVQVKNILKIIKVKCIPIGYKSGILNLKKKKKKI